MQEVFLTLFNISVTAGYIVLAVLLCRLLLKKAPKWVHCVLWAVVGLRLIMPFSIESVFSLIPSAEPIPKDIAVSETPAIHTGITFVNSSVNPILSDSLSPVAYESVNPLQILLTVAAIVWGVGVLAMAVFGAVSWLRLRKKVAPSVRLRDNIWICDSIDTPFIFGVIRPRIYLPSGLAEEHLPYVIAHEQAHLARKDHLWKPLGFLLLTVYWFQPLLWIAYLLLCRDIEKACDEKVVAGLGTDGKKGYSEALVSCSVHRRMVMVCPLAFGEVGVKARVRSVLNYKKPAFWIILLSVLACAVLCVCFLTNPKTAADAALQNEVRHQLAVQNSSEASDTQVTVTDFRILETKTFGDRTTVSLLAITREYHRSVYLELMNENCRPVVMTFREETGEEGQYRLTEYWEPGAGDGEAEIRERFPSRYAEQALHAEEYLTEERDRCDTAARVHFESVLASDPILAELRQTYPQYFGLEYDPNKGLDVFVCQMAEDSYSCRLFPGKADHTLTLDEILDSPVVSIDTMKYILSSYLLFPEQVHIRPFADPLSSYAYTIDGAYTEKLMLLFGLAPVTEELAFRLCFDTATFDVDGDGKEEFCVLGYGPTSGLFTFTFTAREPDSLAYKYRSLFCSPCYKLSFRECEDGVMRVQAIPLGEGAQPILFDISISDGYLLLTKDGTPIGEYLNEFYFEYSTETAP